MEVHEMTSNQPHLIWVNPARLEGKLDAVTWLYTTRELRKLGWRVTLVAYGDSDSDVIQGVPVNCIPTPPVYLLRQVIFHLRFLRLVLREWRSTHVILFHSISTPWVLPLRLLRGLSGRQRPLLVMDTRSLHMPPEEKESFRDRLRKHYHRLMHRLSTRWADGQTTITERMVTSLRTPTEKLWGIWPSGVDLDLFSDALGSRRWPEPGEVVELVYHGVLNYERNLMTFSRAVVTANAEGIPVRFRMVGSGTQEKELQAYAAGTGGVVVVDPPTPHANIPGVLSRAHIGVLPFPDEEKFQVSSFIKMFEYLAAGLPVLATRIGCHTDVMDEGLYVFWASASDEQALLRAIRDACQARDRLPAMALQAKQAAQAWSWHEAAQKLKTALETGLERNPVCDPAPRRDGAS
jgi:glycosyltransferase involved in cell wall biosynthesis